MSAFSLTDTVLSSLMRPWKSPVWRVREGNGGTDGLLRNCYGVHEKRRKERESNFFFFFFWTLRKIGRLRGNEPFQKKRQILGSVPGDTESCEGVDKRVEYPQPTGGGTKVLPKMNRDYDGTVPHKTYNIYIYMQMKGSVNWRNTLDSCLTIGRNTGSCHGPYNVIQLFIIYYVVRI